MSKDYDPAMAALGYLVSSCKKDVVTLEDGTAILTFELTDGESTGRVEFHCSAQDGCIYTKIVDQEGRVWTDLLPVVLPPEDSGE